MADLPQHRDGDANVGEDQETRAGTPRRVYLWWLAGIAVVVLMLVLHAAGVLGPGSH